MTTLIATIILLGVLIFIHELGHYLAARSIGVRVERFSVGYPPRLMTFTSVPDGWEFRLFFYFSYRERKKELDENRVTCFHARRTNFHQTLCVFPLKKKKRRSRR